MIDVKLTLNEDGTWTATGPSGAQFSTGHLGDIPAIVARVLSAYSTRIALHIAPFLEAAVKKEIK